MCLLSDCASSATLCMILRRNTVLPLPEPGAKTHHTLTRGIRASIEKDARHLVAVPSTIVRSRPLPERKYVPPAAGRGHQDT